MKQYKLKNKSTNEEILCTKVVVDGFHYYVSDEKIKLDEYYIDDTNTIRQAITECETYWTTRKSYKKLIATNNPYIDIPQIVDEVEELALQKYPLNYHTGQFNPNNVQKRKDFIEAYNTHAETHTLSDDEVVEFLKWVEMNYYYNSGCQLDSQTDKVVSRTDILQLFKEQQIKTLIYG